MSKNLFRGQIAFQAGLAQRAATKGAGPPHLQVEVAQTGVACNAKCCGVEG